MSDSFPSSDSPPSADASDRPSTLRPGMTGELSGQTYRVAGRITMSMREGGTTYTWDEFFLIGPEGVEATLVLEEGEDGKGPQWRLFRLIEPPPIALVEATTKQVGQLFRIGGEHLRVTCVSESRVVQIDGQAPEGVEQGDVAKYFNAESGNQMFVVSWTGDEVEVFRGIQLPGFAVYRAFGLKPPPLRTGFSSRTISAGGMGKAAIAIVAAVIGAIVVFVQCSRREPRSAPLSKTPPVELRVGATGSIDGRNQRVAVRTTIEFAEVGWRTVRHEYVLADDAGSEAVLSQGEGRDWRWLRPVTKGFVLTPKSAAALKLGGPIVLDGVTQRVTRLFLAQVQAVDGPARAGLTPGVALYGLEASGGNQRILARWNEKSITIYQMTVASENDVAVLRPRPAGQ